MLPSSTGPLGSNRLQLSRLYVAYTSTGGMPTTFEAVTQGTARRAGSTCVWCGRVW